MPLYLIERNYAKKLEAISDVSNVQEVNEEVGIEWLFSFLSVDRKKTYCLYEAPNPEAIREAARRLEIPADEIIELGSSMGPGPWFEGAPENVKIPWMEKDRAS